MEQQKSLLLNLISEYGTILYFYAKTDVLMHIYLSNSVIHTF